jgi:predicted nucleotide-binding protein
LIHRFESSSGKRALIEALAEQKIVAGNEALAEKVAAASELLEVAAGGVLIEQGATDNDVFLIVAGSFDVVVNGRKVNTRKGGDHVGEMAAIQPTQSRSATVLATEVSVVCKLTAQQLTELADEYPAIWRVFAKELARRLEQRNAHVARTHEQIQVFIISTVEALPIARAIQNAFAKDNFAVVIWTDGVFRASWYPVESLEEQVASSDFAIAIAEPVDVTHSRGVIAATPRDNVIFEIGLFIGKIGRKRSFLVEPQGEKVKLPSDLTGITALSYKHDAANLAANVGPACNQMRDIINGLGPNN